MTINVVTFVWLTGLQYGDCIGINADPCSAEPIWPCSLINVHICRQRGDGHTKSLLKTDAKPRFNATPQLRLVFQTHWPTDEGAAYPYAARFVHLEGSRLYCSDGPPIYSGPSLTSRYTYRYPGPVHAAQAVAFLLRNRTNAEQDGLNVPYGIDSHISACVDIA